MWEFVSTRGTCVAPYGTVPTVSCSQNSDCHDGNSCTVDTCDVGTGQCRNGMTDSCCGNFVCESGEYQSKCSDCISYRLSTPTCSSCYSPFGMMFNVQASNDIILTNMSVQLSNGASNVVTVYTARGTFADKATNPASWTQIFSSSFDVSGEYRIANNVNSSFSFRSHSFR